MNKAFVRESDSHDSLCPRCGAPGTPVSPQTLAVFVPADLLCQIGPAASFCPTPTCEAAYFDDLERFIPAASLSVPVYPKDPSAPICPCFGFTCDEIEQDLAEGGVKRTRAAVLRAKSDQAKCGLHSPTGRSCAAEIQKYYNRRR